MTNLAPPDALKAIKPYLTLASQLEAKNDKVIAYYCKFFFSKPRLFEIFWFNIENVSGRLYAVQNGMSINKSAPECKKFLLTLMDALENVFNKPQQ